MSHFTINKDHRTIAVHETSKRVVKHLYIPGHDLGSGYTRHLVQLEEGDTADNPASTKGPIFGPCFICYDVHRTGISVQIYNNPGEFYDDIFETRKKHEAMMADRRAGA